ncbi:hypothetical protein ACFV6Z_09245 [Streptomyces sp. NPDC059818]|uniref:hypothetical protein n=1 Tax=Streptomyces sp. NPDC059818 TaxID=3346962 RepID=UPI00364F5704
MLPPRSRARFISSRAFGTLGAVIGAARVCGQIAGGLPLSADPFGAYWHPAFWVDGWTRRGRGSAEQRLA